MAIFKNENDCILETNNELLIEQYKKRYTEVKENKTKKKEEASK